MNQLPEPIVDYLQCGMTERRIERLLVIATTAGQADAIAARGCPVAKIEHWTPERAAQPISADLRFDLAIVTDALETLPCIQAQRLLSRLRDLNAGSVLVVVGPNGNATRPVWPQADFIALGFRRCASTRHIATGWALYRYDIHDYKITPDWLNSRYWANPERWGRERW